MPSLESVSLVSHLTLVRWIDDQFTSGELHRLVPWLRAQLEVDLAALLEREAKAEEVAARRRAEEGPGDPALREIVDRLEQLVREGHRAIAELSLPGLTAADRLAVFAFHGWVGGELGALSEDRVVALARLGCIEHAELNPAWRYPAELIASLQEGIEAYDRMAPAPVPSEETSREGKLEAAAQTLAQVRYWYRVASHREVAFPELVVIGWRDRELAEAAAIHALAKREQREAKRRLRIEAQEKRVLARLSVAARKAGAKTARSRGLAVALAKSRQTDKAEGSNSDNAGETALSS